LESVLESEEGSAREAALKAAHDLVITDDDPVWVVVQVAEGGLSSTAEGIIRDLDGTPLLVPPE
jgi:hypothetical protein